MKCTIGIPDVWGKENTKDIFTQNERFDKIEVHYILVFTIDLKIVRRGMKFLIFLCNLLLIGASF